jgi:ABC-2 type transport system permease protein
MSLTRSTGIALRVIATMRRDRRTLVLLIVAPLVIMSLVGMSFQEMPLVLDFAAPSILAIFAFLFSFILTGVSFLRERLGGTLERLLATPMGRTDLLVGYVLGFLGFALVQATIVLLYAVYVLDVAFQSTFVEVFTFLAVLTVTGVSLGIFASVFTRNEFQVIQLIPVFFTPQIFLSGVFLPVDGMPEYLQVVSRAMPLRYAVEGLRKMMLSGSGLTDVTLELAVLVTVAVLALGLAGTTVRRA